MLIAGVDEAGRGCVIGPLVVAGILIRQENTPLLEQLEVKDSKLLTAKKREELFPEILRLAEKYAVIKLSPHQIDQAVENQRKLHKLNRLEAATMAKIVDQLKPEVVYVDAADVYAERFANHIQDAAVFKTQIIAEHKADRTYPVVSAASIVAKVERDREIALLREKYGDFGTGYLTDLKTPAFLAYWLKNHDDYPDCVRKSWKPAKALKSQKGKTQTTL
ncbi:MAG: ribonuclease HII [Candidatus Bathyarchaeota archaeon]|nr:ribonuclease HII [Candidatus Bathyarchaeota archaeon]